MNWVIGVRLTRFLAIHSGVVERDGRAVLLPGTSGSGKSTLTSILSSRCWRLLSDEIAIVDPETGMVMPHPRPISLKNDSIDVVKERCPDGFFTRSYHGTAKGTVSFLRPPKGSVESATEPARPTVIVFPQFEKNQSTQLTPIEKSMAFKAITENTPNYSTLLETGFETVARLVETCDHYSLNFRNPDEAADIIEDLMSQSKGARS